MPERLNIPMQTRAASVTPETLDDAARTVEVSWTTGAQVRRYNWLDGEYMEELEVTAKAVRLNRLNNGAPLLDSHRSMELDSVIGVVESAEIRSGVGYAVIRFAEGDDAADRVWNKVKGGIIRNVSVGYHVHEYRETKKGQQRILRAVDWEPLEISLVPVGADAGAGVRANNSPDLPCTITRADGSAPKGDSRMAKKPEDADQEQGQDTESRNQPQPGEGQDDAARSAEVQTPEKPAEQARDGRAESLAIMDLCRLAGESSDTAADMIRRGLTEDQARGELVQKRDARTRAEDEISGQHMPNGDARTAPQIDVAGVYRKFNGINA